MEADAEEIAQLTFVGFKILRIPFSLLIGMISSQPAVLDYAEQQADNPLPGIGYTLMFPMAIIINVILAQVLFLVLQGLGS